MKRKVIQLAGKTLVVSLPSKWAKQKGVVKGAEVEVIEEENGLCIVPVLREKLKKVVSVDMREFDNATIKSVLSVLHKAGFDEIEVVFSSSEQLKVIAERIKTDLLGFEVVQQSSERVVIQNVTGDAEDSFESMMRRVFLVTMELGKGVVLTLQERSSAQELLNLEETNNKLTNYCQRILMKKYNASRVIFLYTLIWLQEKLADDYKEVVRCVEKEKVRPEVVRLAEEVTGCVREFYELVYAKDVQKIALLRKRVLAVRGVAKDPVSAALLSVRQHVLEGLGSLTGLLFVENR